MIEPAKIQKKTIPLSLEMQKIVIDKDLGTIVMRKYRRSNRYVIRLKQGEVRVSLPLSGSYGNALEFVEKNKDVLLREQQAYTTTLSQRPDCDEADLRQQALIHLPTRLHNLAAKHGFVYHKVRISNSRGRWGSCSSKKSINLSLYLMTLPPHLIDYVLLHELCHTKEMNHGPAFWELMDSVTEGKAKELRLELRSKKI